jgi:hypothetical protein
MKLAVMSLLAGAALGSSALAQVGVDGVIGAEWTGPGITSRTVTFNAGAPIGNFGSPTTETNNVAYDTFFRADSLYLYAAVAARTDLGGAINGQQYANLYFSTLAPSNGSVGIEVTNNRFFRGGITTGGPNNDGYYPAGGFATWSSNSTTGVIELAIPLTFFTSDPLSMGFAPSTGSLRWNLSQSLGLSVAGGTGFNTPGGPDERLGVIAIPAPGAAVLAGIGGLAMVRRRRL